MYNCIRYMGHSVNYALKHLRPLTRNFAFETCIFRFGTRQSVGGDAPHFRHIVTRTIVRLLRFDVDVTDIWIGTHVLANSQLAAINFNRCIEIDCGQQYGDDCNATKR